MLKRVGLIIAALCVSAQAANYVVHVNAPTPELNSAFIASTTNQYLGTLTKSTLFANTWTLNITGPNPNYQPPAPPDNLTAQEVLNALVALSTATYPYGWADGIEYGRGVDLGRLSHYIVNCGTPTVFGATSANWNQGVCTSALMSASQDIYDLRFDSPTIVPGY